MHAEPQSGNSTPAGTTPPSGCHAWNPGVATDIPAPFRTLETIVRPECSFTRLADLKELTGLTGLPLEELAVFRPERQALHEVILRVTADIAVAEGPAEEDFGWNFRAIAQQLMQKAVIPRLPALVRDWQQLREAIAAEVAAILERTLRPPPPPAPPRRGWFGIFRRGVAKVPPRPGVAADDDDATAVLAAYRRAGLAADDARERAIYRSLYRVLGAIQITRGRIGNDLELLTRLVTDQVCNGYGSQQLGEWLEPHLDAAIDAGGLTRVPNQDKPVLISLKGASAAGKSSLRPTIKQIMHEQGIESEGYVTISPDVWRRLLLDYETLGEAHKYAGHLTSRELMVIDGKLDRYIRHKANRARAIPHLLVDRFRFDSFESERIGRVLHNTYARYIDTLYMYFVITPPEETVIRGWQRALERGRYKAVDDFLSHSIEAYAGMPKILFKWLAYEHPEYRYVFLDNLVPRGTFPKTVAVGNQREMTLYDPLCFVNIERYQRIDVHARSPGEVYPAHADFSIGANLGFLRKCLRRIPRVVFAADTTAPPYAVFADGQLKILDEPAYLAIRENAELDTLFSLI